MNKKDIKIVFMGTPEFAVESLKAIHISGFTISAVITSCDKPAGRGRKLQESAVKRYALQQGLRLLQPESLKNEAFIEELRAINPDLQIVVAFRMLPEVVWALPKFGTINLHASLLPQYRGAAPINHVIMNGEKMTGLTTFFIEKDIDTGKIIMQKEIEILPDETAGELHDKLMTEGGKLVIDTLNALMEGNLNAISQSKLLNKNEPIKSAKKIFKEDCIINWNDKVENIHNFIRGFSPYPASWTILQDSNGKEMILKIIKTEKLLDNHDLLSGTLLSDNKTFLKITSTDGYINIIELQPEGKKRMKINDWLNGFDISNYHIKQINV